MYQAVCSPPRNPLDTNERRMIRIGMSRPAERLGATLARLAGVPGEPLTWDVGDGPWFDNQVATLDLDGRHATFRLEKAVGGAEEDPRLVQVAERRLA